MRAHECSRPRKVIHKKTYKYVGNGILAFREDIRDVLLVHAGKINPRLLGVQQRNIVKYIRHPQFDYYDTGYYYDIALLILNEVNKQQLSSIGKFVFIQGDLFQ